MPEVYDNWERLVETILKREELRRLALCPSFSSCTSDDDSSCPSLIDSPIVNLTSGAGVGKRGFAAKAATLFAAPAILRTLFLRSKPELQHHVSHASGELRRFSFHELLIATDNFNSINFLGNGGFGDVYEGRLEDGSLVAVKRSKRKPTQQEDREFPTEVEIMSKAMHRNLLHLHGFCATTTERLLVYPLMAHGTVASWLRKTRLAAQPPLGWSTRKRIALGSARGLEFLHQCHPIVIHRDVKAANILLDEDFEAVLCDFGLAILMDRNDTHVITTVRGTIGHIPPECLSTGQVSEKTDVFGYGVMLLELVTGQRVFDLARLANDDDIMLLDWLQKLLKENKLETLIDPELEGNYIKAEGEQLVQLALICTHESPEKRPEMRDVVKLLESDEGLAERWEELQNGGMFRHGLDYESIYHDSDMLPDELSGPR